jgi:hypothetical protein
VPVPEPQSSGELNSFGAISQAPTSQNPLPDCLPCQKAGRVVCLPGDHLVRVPNLLWLFIARPFGLQVNLFVFRLKAL